MYSSDGTWHAAPLPCGHQLSGGPGPWTGAAGGGRQLSGGPGPRTGAAGGGRPSPGSRPARRVRGADAAPRRGLRGNVTYSSDRGDSPSTGTLPGPRRVRFTLHPCRPVRKAGQR